MVLLYSTFMLCTTNTVLDKLENIYKLTMLCCDCYVF